MYLYEILIAERGKASSVLSLKLKQRRTNAHIKRDQEKQEQEQKMINEAKDLKMRIAVLEAQGAQDKASLEDLKQQNKRLKADAAQKLSLPSTSTKPI
jgi:hypothetical protein